MDAPGARVEVLLATYNSERFLGELLESLVQQTFRDFVLVVSDDCSTDGTVDILRAWAPRFAVPPEITVRSTPSGSAAANFASLLAASRGDVVFLADHDDVWLPDKIEAGLTRMAALRRHAGDDAPLLVHGDLEVIDAEGRVTAASFWRYKSISPEYGQRLSTALMHATVTGCTAVLSRSLVELVREIPDQAVMHDWWIDLVACAFGAVDFDPVPRIRYRIHGGNVSRPKRSGPAAVLQRAPRPADVRRWLRLRLDQGERFLDAYRDRLPEPSRRTLEAFASIRRSGPWSRRVTLYRGGFRSPDAWRDLAALIFV